MEKLWESGVREGLLNVPEQAERAEKWILCSDSDCLKENHSATVLRVSLL